MNFVDWINLITKIIGIPSIVYGLIMLTKNIYQNSREKKKIGFVNRNEKINKVRSNSTKENFIFYKEKYQDKICNSYGLIIDKNWLRNKQIKSIDDLELLKNIKVNINNNFDKSNIEVPILKIFPKKKLDYTQSYIQYVKPNAQLFNGRLYAASNIFIKNNKITFEVYETNYYSFMNTCRVLELMYETREKKKKLDIDILDLTNRYCGIGINCFTVLKNVKLKKDSNVVHDYFLIHQRTNKVIESPDKVHVVPAGSYQPMTSLDDIEKGKEFDRDMGNTIYREFCEEILNTHHMKELNSLNLLEEELDYRLLKAKSKVYYLGCGLEPYNTKMEVLALMVIDMEKINDSISEKEMDEFLEMHPLLNSNGKIATDFQTLKYALNKDKFGKDTNISSNVEGNILIEKLSKAMLEQYYSLENATPSSKEIFAYLYKNFDNIFKK